MVLSFAYLAFSAVLRLFVGSRLQPKNLTVSMTVSDQSANTHILESMGYDCINITARYLERMLPEG